jgi:hypothetical protein
MTPNERAKQAILRSTIPPHFSQWWAITISPEQIEALTQTIENAVKAAIEEEREVCLEIVKKEVRLWDRESIVELEGSIDIAIRARSS